MGMEMGRREGMILPSLRYEALEVFVSVEPLTIRSVTARPVDVPLARPIRTASGSLPSAALVLIDVATEQGITGRSYIFGYTPVTLRALTALVGDLAPVVEGRTAVPAERAADFTARFRLLGRQGLLGMALSGLDMAFWDAQGQAAELPAARLLGGAVKPIPAYDSYGIVDPIEDRRALEESLNQGFKAIKIKIGGGDIGPDVECVAAVRDIIGPDVALMLDYNQSLTVPEALRRIDRLARYDPHWIEEPVPAEDLAGHAAIRAKSPVPIQTGENWWFVSDMAKALDAGACDYAMPDLMKIGGVTGWLSAMGLAEAAGMPVSSHAFVEASAHVLPITPTAHWLEFLDKARPIIADPLRVEDGMVRPQGVGLGIAWDEAAVERYLV